MTLGALGQADIFSDAARLKTLLGPLGLTQYGHETGGNQVCTIAYVDYITKTITVPAGGGMIFAIGSATGQAHGAPAGIAHFYLKLFVDGVEKDHKTFIMQAIWDTGEVSTITACSITAGNKIVKLQIKKGQTDDTVQATDGDLVWLLFA